MKIIEAILLGILQGLTEFLPISSSGHLAIVQQIFGIEEADVAFDVMLHLGTLV
ncbi:MAG TPA: undecaprenyl-diphosphate phosphatase, partial [Acetivibrio sp.]|nr:undecaprenyl-diphosphate phosphatase [Acetivibrio sp.]